MNKVAFITGITGQDGNYLSRFLLDKGYEVHGMLQPLAHDDRVHLQDILNDITFHYGDMTDAFSLERLVSTIKPDEIYNLAAQIHVGISFDVPEYTRNVNALGVERLLRSVSKHVPDCRFYQAGTSELFGNSPAPQNEHTPFAPESPYAEAKLEAHKVVEKYREVNGLFAVNGILFNHESPCRGDGFVTQKIVKAAVAIKQNRQDILTLGNVYSKRDWGHAKDYVEGMWALLQQDEPKDYVFASSKTCLVKDFANDVFNFLDMPISWKGEGDKTKASLVSSGRVVIQVSKEFYRPREVNELLGDPSAAKKDFGWSAKTGRLDLIKDMVEAELQRAKQYV